MITMLRALMKKKIENKQELVDNVSCEMEERIKKEMLKIKNTFCNRNEEDL